MLLRRAPARWAIYGYAVLLGFGGRHFGTIVGVGLMGSTAGWHARMLRVQR